MPSDQSPAQRAATPSAADPVELDPLDALLPPPFAGNPADATAAERKEMVEAAVAALPPLTKKPFVAWPHEQRFGAAAADLNERSDPQPLIALYQAVGPYDRYQLLLRAGFDVEKPVADEWAEREPGNPYAALVRSRVLHEAGWEARGHGMGEDVAELGGVTFDAYLKWALELADEAAAAMPGDITPLLVAQQNGPVVTGRDEVLALAERWRAIDRHAYFGNDLLIRQLSPKWHGEDGDLLALANELQAGAPPGHPAHAQVATALAERYQWEVHFCNKSYQEGNDIFRAHAGLLREAAERSVLHPGWRVGFLDGRIRNELAFALYFGDQDVLAWRILKELGGHFTHFPWNLKYADGMQVYEDARAWLVRTYEVD